MPRRKKQTQEKFPYTLSDVLGLEEVYIIINFVQISRKNCKFIAKTEDSMIMEHLFNDCEIKFDKKKSNKGVRYELTPPPVREIPEEAFIVDEEYPDEIIEDGQCF